MRAKDKFCRGEYGTRGFDRNDCSVRAYAVAVGVDYAAAHRALQLAGRQDGNGTFGATIRKLPFLEPMRLPDCWPRRYTVAQFLKDYPRGRFFVSIRNHSMAVVDGVLYNWHPVTKAEVRRAFRVV